MRDELVSVVVISYNAQAYILDLLNSVYAQTYKNIELIIADDCSSDATVTSCREWLKGKEQRFLGVQILAARENRGTVKNLNAGIRASNGAYIKIIAADDILLPPCIEDCICYCKQEGIEFVMGQCEWVLNDGVTPTEHNYDEEKERQFYEGDAKTQYEMLLLANDVICSPGEFYSARFLEKYDYFDEKYDLIEDYPFFLKITSAGEKIHYMRTPVVRYRQSDTSVKNADQSQKIYNERIIRISKRIFYDLRIRGLWKLKKYGTVIRTVWKYFMMDLCIACGNSKKNSICKIARRLA